MNTEKDHLLSKWAVWMKVKNFSPITVKQNLHRITKLFYFLEESALSVTDITYPVAQSFTDWAGILQKKDGNLYSRETLDGWMNACICFGQFLSDENIIIHNPFSELERIKRDLKLPRTLLTEADMKRLLDYLRDSITESQDLVEYRSRYKIHVLAEVLYSTGLRIAEVASVRVQDVNIDAKTITVVFGKGGFSRSVFLTEYTASILSLYLEYRELYVFTEKNSKNLLFGSGKESLMRLLKKYLDKASTELGFGKIRCHDFRHTFAYHLLRAGCDIRRIQALLGHRWMKSTEIYTRVEKTDLSKVINDHHPRRFKGV